MRIILPCCFKRPEKMLREPKISGSKQYSSPRISLLDLSNPGSSLSIHDLSNSLVGSNLYIFTLRELKVITHNFSSTNFLGKGGFGPVYKGFIDDKTRAGLEAQPVAVKVLDSDGSQGHREWLAEVVFLGQLKHPNLVKLIGYCYEDEQRLLVYQYMARGNLDNKLFGKYCISLPWSTRIKIAVGAAKGLAFLHGEEKPVIFRDFKTSNILLDSDYSAKLSDFGLATDGPEGDETHVTTRVMGTKGYAAPEYIMTGHLTTMSDVYSFGVVLLELITGRRSMDKKRPNRKQNLVEWARPILKDPQKLDRIIDPRLEGQYSMTGAKITASVAHKCLRYHAKSRPTMSNVVKILEPLLMELDDFPTKPFVYIVPSEKIEGKGFDEKGNEAEEELKRMGNKNGYEQKERKKKGYRHKHPLSSLRSRVLYSDNAYKAVSSDWKT